MADSSSHSSPLPSIDSPSSLSSPEPPSFMTVTSAASFNSYESFQDRVYSRLMGMKEYHMFEFIEIPDLWARNLIENLDEEVPLKPSKTNASEPEKLEAAVPPRTRITYNKATATLRIKIWLTLIHECVLPWLNRELIELSVGGSLTLDELRSLSVTGPADVSLRSGVFAGSIKQPDCWVRPRGHGMPTIAIETGWSESMPQLRSDKDLLLIGGQPHIRVVVIVKWAKLRGGRVRGELEVWKPNAPQPHYRETIFPAPNQAAPQLITIRRDDLFGRTGLLPGRNGNDNLTLDIQRLRDEAIDVLNQMGLIPA